MAQGTQDFTPDPRNENILINDDQQRIADDCRASYEALVRYCV